MALNPISFTEQVVSDFLRYQLTTYPLADANLHGQMRDLLRLNESRSTPLRQGPFVSLSRPFKSGATIDQLVREGVLHEGMRAVASYPSVRQHQENAIRSIRKGKTTLVATGTGSGKTETFLYPIISRCLDLADANAPAGIVAVLVYPMNALAEDQLDRLRGLLAGRSIAFGMYVGKTPDEEAGLRGERMPHGSSNGDYRARLLQMREAGESATLLPAEERASRAAMRKEGGQPRILLTNVKQLELLLTRGKDIGLFANAPLEFLVFDEAHTFRGAQGAETACLIRRLRSFCGKEASEVTCVATSATMADPERGPVPAADFAHRFFGVDATNVEIVGEVHDELRWNERRAIPTGPLADAPGLLSRLLSAVDAPDAAVAAALSTCLVELGGARLPEADWQRALASQLASNELVHQLAGLLRTARALEDLPSLLREEVGREVSEHEILCWLALGVACGRDAHDPLLRPVVHSFIRGVGGAVVTLSNQAGAARLWLAGEEADAELGEGWRRFPLLTCTTCGQHYYETWVKDFRLVAGTSAAPEGGDLAGTIRVWEHLSDELGGARVLLVDRLVVRPDEDDDIDTVDEDGNVEAEVAALPSGHEYQHRRLHPLWVCGHCGGLHEKDGPACAACHVAGALSAVQAVRCKEELPGVLHSCVACQAPGRRPGGGRYREPARPVRAVSVSDVHVLAQSMLHLSERRRLLVFADNRQDAAFQAGWMRDHARRFRLRALMSQAIPVSGASVGDVAQRLDAVLEADRELSRALIPEVWQVAPQEDAGVKHREERLYFLRLQALREIATGVKQRIGLEPWGRVRIEYVGLDAGHDVIGRWAQRLGFEPAALAEGIAALLDHLRRIRVLHDEPTRLFGKLWRDGDKEIQYGYLPSFSGGPRGVKLSRLPADSPARVTQWSGTRPTQIWNAASTWRIPENDLEDFLRDLWGMLAGAKLLVPVTLEGWGKPLPGSAGTFQIDATKLRLLPHRGRWRCEKCRRTTVRHGPTSTCLAWRCAGKLGWEENDPDDFDLHVLDGNYAMLRVAEHSAQVPADVRERIENQFKGQGEHLNALVCTPTLELGVDIGALDAVLMRNVPPSAANYWQRAGRAGRRHRMAVDITYAQATGFDQSYFRDPLKLLGGVVEPPRFNLKNEVMLRKHVHATVLTTLHGLGRRSPETVRLRTEEVLARCFPSTLKTYLFTPGGEVRKEILDVSELGLLIREERRFVMDEVTRTFGRSWPKDDVAAVQPDKLATIVDRMADSLAEVLQRFKRRLDWARGELARLGQDEARKGVLDPEDQAHRRRCQRVIERLKGQAMRTRSQAQGGSDDSDTMGALAREGFLPGYGLESGSIVGTAEPPRMTYGLAEFDLPRAPTMALREYVPGNAIYANGFRFVPRRFQLVPDETMRFRIDPERQVVQELGTDAAAAMLGEQEIRAVPVCDVILPSQSQISDEEDFRFQMPVAIYATERGFHRGGSAWSWGDLDIRSRRALQLRMVNVGPRAEVTRGNLGYLLCLACGQSHSPFASARSREEFVKKHQDRCAHRVDPTGFFADVEVDVLGLHDIEDRVLAFSFVESLRMGAARVLDMEVEDLQIIALGHAGEDRVDVMLYDPMPGGSGLLEQLAQRWEEVRAAAIELVETCPGACERSCVDCLQTYRNRFYHEHLDRHRAAEVLKTASGPLVMAHPIPENLPKTPTTAGQPQTVIEYKFKRLLNEAGLPAPVAQQRIILGTNLYTTPDFFYAGDDADEPGIAIYLDGMAGHIHGNAEQADKDRFLRETLRSRGYEVVEVRSFELDDKNAVVTAIARIAKYLIGKEKQRALRDDTAWFDRARDEGPARGGRVLRLVRLPAKVPGSVPIVDLRAAAGSFSEGQVPAVIAFARVEGAMTGAGHFVAQVVGDSMDEVAPAGAWCLWEHLGADGVAAAAPGQKLLVRRPDYRDSDLGEYTFKQLAEGPDGRYLAPRSTNGSHQRIVLDADASVDAIARFVAVLEEGGSD
jgi:SOS-response transcriptional repressor LexA